MDITESITGAKKRVVCNFRYKQTEVSGTCKATSQPKNAFHDFMQVSTNRELQKSLETNLGLDGLFLE